MKKTVKSVSDLMKNLEDWFGDITRMELGRI